MAMTGLMTGLTLATARVQAQVIHTDARGLAAGEVRIPVRDGALPGYAARPQGSGPFPTVLVIEEIFGVNEYIKDICRRLAHAGFLAVAPELYARLADLSKITDPERIVRDVILKAPDATLLSDLDSAAEWAVRDEGDPARLAVLGFCRGGRDTWLYAAHNAHLKCAVAFYGPLGGPTSAIQPRTAIDVAPELKCPLLALYGGRDPSISEAARQSAAAAAHSAGRTVEMVVYPEAGHGFHADYRPSYDRAAAQDGWARALAWLQQHGV
jgi:carboxymethylenebutenolidase